MPTSQSRTRALVALSLAAGPATVGAAEIPYREAFGYAVVVPVHVQGVGPFDFLLDTGTDVTVVHETVAGQIGLVPASRIEVAGVAGRRVVPQASVEALALGPVALGPMDVLVHDLRAVRGKDERIAGILGQNALRRVTFTIDHAARRVLVRETVASSADVVYTGAAAGRPTIAARLRCAGDPLHLVLDSGIGGIVLFEGTKRLPLNLPDRTIAQTNIGTAALRAGRLEALCVGRARLVDVPVAVQDRHAPGDPPEDGLLPTRLFARVHFDARGKVASVEPW
jgi:hypothetical protein